MRTDSSLITRAGVLTLACAAMLAMPTGLDAQSATAGAAEAESQDWRLFADYRLRGAMDRNRRNAPDRERIRIRFRFGGEVDLLEGLTVGARLSTEPDPEVPNSPYIDLGDGFSRARFAFDRLYVRWRPSIGGTRNAALWAGKFANPFQQPTHYSELVWDADVHPEGLAATFEPIPALRFAAGGYSLLNRGGASDVNVAALQAALRLEPGSEWEVRAALGGYFFGDIDASAAADLASRNRGNELIRDTDGEVIGFASGFDIWQAHGSLSFSGLPTQVTVGGEYFSNASAADGSDGTGFAVSGGFGRLEGAGSGAVEYRYQEVGQEAVFSSLVQDDFLDATDFEGHLVSATWQFLSFARVRAWTLWSRQPGEEGFQRRYRLDLDLSWRTP